MKKHILFALLLGLPCAPAQTWKPVPGGLTTKWAAQVDPADPLPEYPRPQMTRKEWRSLNGLWSYAVAPKDALRPDRFADSILVPFPIESALSGVRRPLKPEERLWYRRTFQVPAAWKGRRVLVHFGAVDWHASVFVNGRPAGEHKGGYTPFSFDVTPLLGTGDQELVVSVTDPTDSGTQPRGKQTREPSGIWYTSVSGIWQTVWMEPVPEASVAALRPVSDVDGSRLNLTVVTRGPAEGLRVQAVALDGGREVGSASGSPGGTLALAIPSPRLWSPESPALYGLRVTLSRAGTAVDEVDGYFAMRKISLGKDEHGRTRILLNNRPYFQLGPLDQGWWPDGLYTAPADEALRSDIETMKKFGFNMARKHVKVEPARWYHHCDRLGLLVWQDIPNGNLQPQAPNNLRVSANGPDAQRDPQSAAQFEAEMKEMMEALQPFPSIVVWVPFNEGWGQYDTARVARAVKQADPSRLVDAPSGWADRGVGDICDIHVYTGPGIEVRDRNRAAVLGEFGGISMPVEGHLWGSDRNWGYALRQTPDELYANYARIVSTLRGPLALGLSAAIYTQITDVESEINGLLTYDRAVEKYDAARLRALHAGLYEPAPAAEKILPEAGEWRFTTAAPGAGWEAAGYKDDAWEKGRGVLQSAATDLFAAGARWDTPEIWARRSFDASFVPVRLWLTLVHGLESGEVYLNGEKVFDIAGLRPSRRHYTHFDLGPHASLLHPGKNVIGIHGRQPNGWHGLDAGLYGVAK